MRYAIRKVGQRLGYYVAFLVFFVFATAPALVKAQDDDGLNLDPPDGLAGSLDESGQAWWDTIATGGVWIAIAAGALLWIFGMTRYIRWAFLALVIFTFGDVFAEYFFGLGGSENAIGRVDGAGDGVGE